MQEFNVNPNRLYRDTRRGKILGVCAGLADYFNWDVLLVRIAVFVSFFIFSGTTIIAYFVLGFILDKKPRELAGDQARDKFWREMRTEPKVTLSAINHKFMEMEKRIRNMETFVTSKEFQFHKEVELS